MNPIQAVSSGFRGYTDFESRSSRSEFWWWILFATIVMAATQVLDPLLGTPGVFARLQYYGLLYILANLGLFLPYLAVMVRRLPDRGRSSFWILIAFVPIIGVILLIVWLVRESNEGTNNYCQHPKTKLDDGTPSVGREGRQFCSNCEIALREDASFCASCGTQV